MKHQANIDFISFRDKVLPLMSGSSCDVRRAIGAAARRIPRIPNTNAPVQDFEWNEWLHEVELPKKTPHKYDWLGKNQMQRDMTNFVSKLQGEGSGSRKLAAAIYYRLHYHVENLEYAWSVDEVAFGKGKKFNDFNDGQHVFIPRAKSQLEATFPIMQELDASHVYERSEYKLIKSSLLPTDQYYKLRSTILHGPGGYGKTSLAEELCFDKTVISAFSGGIYWLQFSMHDKNQQASEASPFKSIPRAIEEMLHAQGYDLKAITLLAIHDISRLLDLLPEDKPRLLIADDIWEESQIRWLNAITEKRNVSVLLTTRNKGLVGFTTEKFAIGKFSVNLSYELLTNGIFNLSTSQKQRIQNISKGFKGWPLIINLANAKLKIQKSKGPKEFDNMICELEEFLASDQIVGWDNELIDSNPNYEKRRKVVSLCIEAGLTACLDKHNQLMLRSLGVFPDDINIPLYVLKDYMHFLTRAKPTNEQLYGPKLNTFLELCDSLSFFRDFNLSNGKVRLHDEILTYFRGSFTLGEQRQLHHKLVSSIKENYCEDGWHTLSPDTHKYAWKYLVYHMEMSGDLETANKLRTDLQWLKNSLIVSGISTLQDIFSSNNLSRAAQTIKDALAQSTEILVKNPNALGVQLYGRIGHINDKEIKRLISSITSDLDFWPKLIWPHLNPTSKDRERTSYGALVGARFSIDGTKVVTCSRDGIGRVISVETGSQISQINNPHNGWLTDANFNNSGTLFFTAAMDNQIRIWDTSSGIELESSRINLNSYPTYVTFNASGTKILVATADGHQNIFTTHQIDQAIYLDNNQEDQIRQARFYDEDSKLVMASSKGVLSFWNVSNGQMLLPSVSCHSKWIDNLELSLDESYVVTGAGDKTAKILETSTGNTCSPALIGHENYISSVMFHNSGESLLTSSGDSTTRIWQASTGKQITKPLVSSTYPCNFSSYLDDKKSVITISADNSVSIWEISTEKLVGTVHYDSRPIAMFSENEHVSLCLSDGMISKFIL